MPTLFSLKKREEKRNKINQRQGAVFLRMNLRPNTSGGSQKRQCSSFNVYIQIKITIIFCSLSDNECHVSHISPAVGLTSACFQCLCVCVCVCSPAAETMETLTVTFGWDSSWSSLSSSSSVCWHFLTVGCQKTFS